MKVNLKLFAGLFVIGTVAAIVPIIVFTSCKSDPKQQEDKNESLHEKSVSFTFNAQHDDLNALKEFLKTEWIINPNPNGLTIGDTDEDGHDFAKTTIDGVDGAIYNALMTNSDKARKLLFSKEMVKFHMKYYILFEIINGLEGKNYSDTFVDSAYKSTSLNIKFSQNNATLISTDSKWKSDGSSPETSTTTTTMNYSDGEISVVFNAVSENPMIFPIESWSFYKKDDEYCLKYEDRGDNFPVEEEDFGLLKAFYNTAFPT